MREHHSGHELLPEGYCLSWGHFVLIAPTGPSPMANVVGKMIYDYYLNFILYTCVCVAFMYVCVPHVCLRRSAEGI